MQPNSILRSPSSESCDWFKTFVNYAESVRSSPIPARSPLHDLLLNFGKPLDKYEDEYAFKQFSKNAESNRPHLYLEDATFLLLAESVQEERQQKNWLNAAVEAMLQVGGDDDTYLTTFGVHLGQTIAFGLGDKVQGRRYLEHGIDEMQRLNFNKVYKMTATLDLAACHIEQGNFQHAESLLKDAFEAEYTKLEGVSSELFEKDHCRMHVIRRIKSTYTDISSDLPWDFDSPSDDEGDEEDWDFIMRVSAVRLIAWIKNRFYHELIHRTVSNCIQCLDKVCSLDGGLEEPENEERMGPQKERELERMVEDIGIRNYRAILSGNNQGSMEEYLEMLVPGQPI
jgi:hypothetical protein